MTLAITTAYLDELRRQVLAYLSDVPDLTRAESAPSQPPQSVLDWFMGIEGESDSAVIARLMQTVWWLDTTCAARRHIVKQHWGCDIFRFTIARFAPERDRVKALQTLMPVCLAFADLLMCVHCWEQIRREAPSWTVAAESR